MMRSPPKPRRRQANKKNIMKRVKNSKKVKEKDRGKTNDEKEQLPLIKTEEERPKDNEIDQFNDVSVITDGLLTVSKSEQEHNLVICREEDPLSSPQPKIAKKTEDRQITASLKRQKALESTPLKTKKKKPNELAEYDQLWDVIKSELLDNEHLKDYEPIDMLHDLDSVMDFKDNKISEDILMSSLTTNGTVQSEQNQTSDFENNRDPPTDPLYIDKNETYEEEEDEESEEEKDTDIDEKKKRTNSRRSGVYKMRVIENKKASNTNKKHSTDDVDDYLSKSQRKKLSEMKIKLVHVVPPQHKIEHTGAIAPTQIQRRIFLRYGPLRKGTFSPMEDNTIRENWETFCRIHNWNPKEPRPFLHMRHENKFYIKAVEERLKFAQFLANGLPWRTLYSVHCRFKKLYEKRKNLYARYRPEEDRTILEYVRKYGRRKNHNVFATLSKILGRGRCSIWLRYQTLTKKAQNESEAVLTKVEWTRPLAEKFLKNLMKITLSEELVELKDAVIPKAIWLKLEEKMNINYMVLKQFWMHQLHIQLFCPYPIYLNDIKLKLIEYIYNKGVSSTREIIWPNVAKYFEGITPVFLCKVFFNLVKEASFRVDANNFSLVVKYLYKEKIPDLREGESDKFLPRLVYKNGKLKILDEDISNDTDTE